MFEILLDPSAEQDIDEIFKWYERQREGLGFEFLISLITLLKFLLKIHMLISILQKTYKE